MRHYIEFKRWIPQTIAFVGEGHALEVLLMHLTTDAVDCICNCNCYLQTVPGSYNYRVSTVVS